MNSWHVRAATMEDIPNLAALIPLSVTKLQSRYYSPGQIEGALGTVFAVDRQLIKDGTYFVVENAGQIVGCGGWSKRKSRYGGDDGRKDEDPLLLPDKEPALVRAFFVHPEFARKGIGKAIMGECEKGISRAGFKTVEIVATLAGEPLYASFGYVVLERSEIPLKNGLSLPVVWMQRAIST